MMNACTSTAVVRRDHLPSDPAIASCCLTKQLLPKVIGACLTSAKEMSSFESGRDYVQITIALCYLAERPLSPCHMLTTSFLAPSPRSECSSCSRSIKRMDPLDLYDTICSTKSPARTRSKAKRDGRSYRNIRLRRLALECLQGGRASIQHSDKNGTERLTYLTRPHVDTRDVAVIIHTNMKPD